MRTPAATVWARLKHTALREEKPDTKHDLLRGSLGMEYWDERTHRGRKQVGGCQALGTKVGGRIASWAWGLLSGK